MDYPRLRERSETNPKQSQTVFSSIIHRAGITSLLISDAIYTSSLDYTIKKASEVEGEYHSSTVSKFRGGVEFVSWVNGKVYGSGRDCYLRSVDGLFHCKFESAPVKFYESDRGNLLSMGLRSNKALQFDLEKRVEICSLHTSIESQMMGKLSKDVYIGDKQRLFLLDWRKKSALVEVYKAIHK